MLAGHSGHMADFLREQQALLKEFKGCTDLHNQLAKVVMEGQDKIKQGVQEVICLLTLLVAQNEGKGKGWAVNPPEQEEVQVFKGKGWVVDPPGEEEVQTSTDDSYSGSSGGGEEGSDGSGEEEEGSE